jgi:hypothetical protein
MNYLVKVTQTLHGYVEVEANSKAEAEQAAFDHYVMLGQSLDDCNMDDDERLEFEAVEVF